MIFAKGDIIMCTDNKGLIGLTVGKKYTCLHYDNCTDRVLITNDNCAKDRYASVHFKKV